MTRMRIWWLWFQTKQLAQSKEKLNLLFSERSLPLQKKSSQLSETTWTSMLSSSFENCTDCQPKTVEIKTAEEGVVMTTTHVCMKTYYVRSRTRENCPLTTKAIIVPSLRSDLICRIPQPSRIQSNPWSWSWGIRNIPNIQWKNSQIEIFCIYEWSLKKNYIKAEAMSEQQFGKVSGYEKWHRKLGHTTNREIHDTIPYVKVLEELTNKAYQQHTKCASCMIGKSAPEDFPELRTRADKPLKQVKNDTFSSSVVSI